ncbi:MAG TPA: hypothetical protein GXX37_13835 [Clostridiaceae bacterium]|nr:hypothetical protein [Clostridiaceae bacterium]
MKGVRENDIPFIDLCFHHYNQRSRAYKEEGVERAYSFFYPIHHWLCIRLNVCSWYTHTKSDERVTASYR